MFRRITVGLKGGMLPVASVAERLLKLGGCYFSELRVLFQQKMNSDGIVFEEKECGIVF